MERRELDRVPPAVGDARVATPVYSVLPSLEQHGASGARARKVTQR
jgi:hypothetical protein